MNKADEQDQVEPRSRKPKQIELRKGQLSRSDLLEAIANNDQPTADYLAKQLGLERSQQVLKSTKPAKTAKQETATTPASERAIVANESAEKPSMGFWRLESRATTVQQQVSTQPNQEDSQTGWSERPQTLPVFQPISTPHVLLPRLLHHLKHQRLVRAVDADAVVKKLGRGEYLQRIPRLSRRSLGRHLCVLEDRHLHLTPYWRDQSLFAGLLASYLPEYANSHAILLENNPVPQSLSANAELDEWSLPPENSVVVVFSDLGALSVDGEQQVEHWLTIAVVLQQRACKLLALIPCQPELCDPRLRALFTLIPWEINHQDKFQEHTISSLKMQAHQLLSLLAPVIRLEPALLRSVRLALFPQQIQFNASVEALVWQHADLLEPSSVAASFNPEARQRRLREFSQFPEAVRKTVLDSIRPWRSALQFQVWFEEMSSLDAESRRLLPVADLEDANRYFQQLSQPGQSKDEALVYWYKRLEKRLPQQSIDLSGLGASLQRISYQLHQHDQQYRADLPIDPANLLADDEPRLSIHLYQQGEQLIAVSQAADSGLAPNVSRLAQMQLRNGVLYYEIELANSAIQSTQQPSEIKQTVLFQTDSQQITQVCTLADAPGLLLRSDEETLYFNQLQRPQWAKHLGRDAYGLYLDIEIKGISQGFRWIEPGTFLMGSPGNEAERYDDEVQHQVTLTQGFWLADSTVTQALWQAVMGNNPSYYNDNPKHPVEQVSWDDVQEFITEINRALTGLQARLPTEAQWEYACRAGTTTAFSFGDNITSQQVNYNAEYPYANAAKGTYRGQTVAVKSLQTNLWGLYEMHGNVWEWCEDVWEENLGTASVIDPLQTQSSETGVLRVVRGGSWGHDGRRVRSAIRYGSAPDYRSGHLGFRLSLGH